jgi:hypothetical protein
VVQVINSINDEPLCSEIVAVLIVGETLFSCYWWYIQVHTPLLGTGKLDQDLM